jgi:hypothetical protein
MKNNLPEPTEEDLPQHPCVIDCDEMPDEEQSPENKKNAP